MRKKLKLKSEKSRCKITERKIWKDVFEEINKKRKMGKIQKHINVKSSTN